MMDSNAGTMKKIVIALGLAMSMSFALHDVGVTAMLSPDTLLEYPNWVEPEIVIRNFGTSWESMPVRFAIDSAGHRVYDQAQVIERIYPGEERTIRFPVWVRHFGFYSVTSKAFTSLVGDENRSNDTLRRTSWITGGSTGGPILVEGGRCVVDGHFTDEDGWFWGYDISDTRGQAGWPKPRGSCVLYVGDDYDYTYIGVSVQALDSRRDGDRVIIKMDENYDRWWPTDPTEGIHELVVRGGVDSVLYSFLPGQQCPGCTSASSVLSGNLQFEARIPIGTRPGDYDVDPHYDYTGASISFWRGDTCYGWWPESLLLTHWDSARYFGEMWWDWMAVEEPETGGRMDADKWSHLARGTLFLPASQFTIHYSLFDLNGRKVADLHPGANDVWHLSPGVYFVVTPHPDPLPQGERGRNEPSAVCRRPSAVAKVLLAR